LENASNYTDIRILRIRSAHQLGKIAVAASDISYLQNHKNEINANILLSLIIKQLHLFKNEASLSQFLNRIGTDYQENTDFQLAAAEANLKLGNTQEAKRLMKSMAKNALNDKQKYQLRTLQKSFETNTIFIDQELLSFLKDFSTQKSWHASSIGYLHNFKWGSLGANITHSSRFVDQGTLYTLESYPQLGSKLYAHINLNYSSKNDFYQNYGVSASLFLTVLKKVELEGGFRHLTFNQTTFFTSIVGGTLYDGDYYINLRAAIGPKILDNYIQNYQLTIRRYLNDSESYLFAKMGTGISPDESLQLTQLVNAPDLKSYYAVAGISKWYNRINLSVTGGYQLQEITATRNGNQLIANLGAKYRF